MAVTDLVPWRRGEQKVLVRREGGQGPFDALQRNVNRLFEDFFGEAGLRPFSAFGETFGQFSPRIDVSESEKEISISAELPGLDEDDFEVSLAHNTLTISGEKKAEQEEEGKDYYRVERSYGAFRRTIPLSDDIQADKAEATFKKGILTITLPKTPEPQKRSKKIPIKTG